MSSNDNLVDKDWLDLAWKYFQQHAQQRINYFNYFVLFSTILTTGMIATFQPNFQGRHLGIGIGCLQAFLAFMFKKIDDRNKFLTNHSENVIRSIEQKYENLDYKLFTKELEITNDVKLSNRSRPFYNKHLTHGQSYRTIYITFLIIGSIETLCSAITICQDR